MLFKILGTFSYKICKLEVGALTETESVQGTVCGILKGTFKGLPSVVRVYGNVYTLLPICKVCSVVVR